MVKKNDHVKVFYRIEIVVEDEDEAVRITRKMMAKKTKHKIELYRMKTDYGTVKERHPMFLR